MEERKVTVETEGNTEERRDLNARLEWIWEEIKTIGRQVEQETRRGGRIARLRFEIRGLRRKIDEQHRRLGRLVHEAQRGSDKRPSLARLEGYDEIIARLAELEAQIAAKDQEIGALRQSGAGRAEEDTGAPEAQE